MVSHVFSTWAVKSWIFKLQRKITENAFRWFLFFSFILFDNKFNIFFLNNFLKDSFSGFVFKKEYRFLLLFNSIKKQKRENLSLVCAVHRFFLIKFFKFENFQSNKKHFKIFVFLLNKTSKFFSIHNFLSSHIKK